MHIKSLLAGLAIFSSVAGAALPASADELCGSMLMPAAGLKQVGRGYIVHGHSVYHSGIDLLAPYGSPVRAAEAGTVVFAGKYFGYGNMVDVQHEGGVVTRYAHLSRFAPGIQPGAAVPLGGLLGDVGTSGYAHGAHLHFEVRVHGEAIDPAPALALAECPAGPVTPREPIEEARAPESSATKPPAPMARRRNGKHH